MLGDNPIRQIENSDGKKLYVKEIFPTIQAEGTFSGHAAVFIRLGGCNLACKFCDTEFEDFSLLPAKDILKEVIEVSENNNEKIIRKLVVISGGEPLRQNIKFLCDELIKNNYTVQVETNGTLYQELNKKVFIICSPKAINGKYTKIRGDLLKRINAFKFLVSKFNEGYSEIPDVGQAEKPVFIQAIDMIDKHKNKINKQLAEKLAKFHNAKLSVQYHKILGLK